MTNALALIPVKVKAEILKAIEDYSKKAKKLVIVNDKSLTVAIESISEIKKLGKDLELRRKELTDPKRKELEIINAEFKQFSGWFDQIEKDLKTKIGNYNDQKEKERLEEQARLDKEKEKEQAKLDKKFERQVDKLEEQGVNVDLLAKPTVNEDDFKATVINKTVKTATGASVTTKKVWTFRVVDEAKIPRNFLILDEKKVREAIRNEVRYIDGLEIYQDSQITVK